MFEDKDREKLKELTHIEMIFLHNQNFRNESDSKKLITFTQEENEQFVRLLTYLLHTPN